MRVGEEPAPKINTPSLYSHEVLNGNWFERRLASKIDKKAIAPSITGKSDCIAHKSVYQLDYLPQVPPRTLDEVIEMRNDVRVEAYANRMHGNAGNISLNDGDQFLKNITTTTDASYRIIPKLICLDGSKKVDIFGVYGNATKTGRLAWMKCEAKKVTRSDMSVMKTDFIPLPIKPIKLCKGPK